MTFANDYTHLGTLDIEVNGTTACTTYDRITVTGNAALSGTLAASISNSFSFQNENIITFIDAGSISGTFSQISPALPTGWNVRYNYPNAGEVSLEFTSVNAVCQDVNLTLDGSGNASLLAPQVDNGSTAGAGIQSIPFHPAPLPAPTLEPIS